MNLIIKPMETSDEIDGKAFVHWKSWHQTYRGLVNPSYLDQLTLEKCIHNAHRWSDDVLIAKDDTKVIGFVAYGASRDDGLTHAGEIYALYVLQDYQKRKVGYQLLCAAMNQLKQYKNITLWVLKENLAAIDFYKKCGFIADGVEQDVVLGVAYKEIRMMLVR